MRAIREWTVLLVLAFGFGSCCVLASRAADAQAERVARGNLTMRAD